MITRSFLPIEMVVLVLVSVILDIDLSKVG
jgi:hypothetical protein